MLEIFYEDRDVIVAKKPAGLESQSVHSFAPDMVSLLRNQTGSGYIGVVHRLDQPVSGLMVYAKTQEAAACLSRQLQQGRLHKVYKAVVCGQIVDNVGNFVDYLLKDPRDNRSKIVEKGTPGAKRAELRYRALASARLSGADVTLVRIELLTGRHHQIRVQFAGHGYPLWGDLRYNSVPAFPAAAGDPAEFSDGKGPQGVDSRTGCGTAAGERRELPEHTVRGPVSLALCACELSFCHPASGKPMTFSMEPEGEIWRIFG